MMKYLTWWILLGVLILYLVVVSLFAFAGPIGLGIQFIRITVVIAGTVLYIRMLPELFKEIPPPRRDYLMASIIFFLLSLDCFSFWNEAGRIWSVDTSVFTSYISGGFSMLAITAAVLAILAPDTGGNSPKIVAVAIGAILGGALVFVAPLFR